MPNRNKNANQTMKRSSVKKTTRTQRKQSQKKKSNRNNQVMSMSPCAVAFASVLSDPFGTPSGACLPGLFPMPSVKRKDIIRSTMVLGTSGYGFVTLRPDGANDSVALVSTSGSTALIFDTPIVNATSVVSQFFTTLPYTNSQLNSTQVQWRAVGVGLRIRYFGREDARNGVVTCYEVPNHASANNLSIAQISSEFNARREHPTCDGRWHSVFSSGPKHPNDLEFQAAAPFENPYLVICVSGEAGDKYEVEAVQHIELVGPYVANLSPSISDPTGYSRVINVVQEATSTEPLSFNTAKQVFNAIVGTITDAAAFHASISPLFRRGAVPYDNNRISL